MKEMHKWKDKVEVNLDNRQIFFLFFGVSVVGCFVFALGLMVGRRIDFDPRGDVAALAPDSLDLLGEAEDELPSTPLQFKAGLQTPATLGLPETRDPDAPVEDAADAVPARAVAEPEESPMPSSRAASTEQPEEPRAPTTRKPAAAPARERESVARQAHPSAPSRAQASAPRSEPSKFTLQMKAFSRPADAEAFAANLRSQGHDVRIEIDDVKGRVWHRVRVGHFATWAEGLAAKEAFEKKAEIIAYVVRE